MADMASRHSQNPSATKSRHGFWNSDPLLVGAVGPRHLHRPLEKSDCQKNERVYYRTGVTGG